MKKIAFIIINYNNIPDTVACLDSFMRFNRGKDDIYLIDNGSKQQISDIDILPYKKYLSIKLIVLSKNCGFAEGNNIGIREAQKVGYDYYVLLNNDTELVDDSIIKLMKYMDSHHDVGIGGLVNYYFSAPDIIWQAGAKFIVRRFDYRQVQVVDKSSDLFTEVDYVPGSSFFIRKEVIDKIGLLDPNYFAYREEADFCWRAKQMGFKIGYLPNTRILHKVGKSSTSFIKQYLRFRNDLYFCSKFGTKTHFLIVYARIVKRTLIIWKHAHYDSKVLRSTVIAINDFRKGILGMGSMDKVK